MAKGNIRPTGFSVANRGRCLGRKYVESIFHPSIRHDGDERVLILTFVVNLLTHEL